MKSKETWKIPARVVKAITCERKFRAESKTWKHETENKTLLRESQDHGFDQQPGLGNFSCETGCLSEVRKRCRVISWNYIEKFWGNFAEFSGIRVSFSADQKRSAERSEREREREREKERERGQAQKAHRPAPYVSRACEAKYAAQGTRAPSAAVPDSR